MNQGPAAPAVAGPSLVAAAARQRRARATHGGRGEDMSGLLYIVGTTLGGWLGWGLGERFGFMPAFFLSVVGSALGIYVARRVTRHFLG